MSDLVFIKNNKLPTNSLVLAGEFGRNHKDVLKSIRSLEDTGHFISGREFSPTYYVDVQAKERPMYELTERGFLIAMPFIGGKKSRDGQVKLVDAFLTMRDQLQNRTMIMQKELQDFSVECQLSKDRATIAGRALRKRRDDICTLDHIKVVLEGKYQLRLIG